MERQWSTAEEQRYTALADTLTALSERWFEQEPALMSEATRALDDILGDADILLSYTRLLEAKFNDHFRMPLPIFIGEPESIIPPGSQFPAAQGWEEEGEALFIAERRIRPQHLRDLLLNPYRLWHLAAAVQQRVPEIWTPLLMRWGREMCTKHQWNVTLPAELQQALAALPAEQRVRPPQPITPITVLTTTSSSTA